MTNNILTKKRYLLVSTFIGLYSTLYLNGQLSYPLNIFDFDEHTLSCEWEQNKLRDFQILSIGEAIKNYCFIFIKLNKLKKCYLSLYFPSIFRCNYFLYCCWYKNVTRFVHQVLPFISFCLGVSNNCSFLVLVFFKFL